MRLFASAVIVAMLLLSVPAFAGWGPTPMWCLRHMEDDYYTEYCANMFHPRPQYCQQRGGLQYVLQFDANGTFVSVDPKTGGAVNSDQTFQWTTTPPGLISIGSLIGNHLTSDVRIFQAIDSSVPRILIDQATGEIYESDACQ